MQVEDQLSRMTVVFDAMHHIAIQKQKKQFTIKKIPKGTPREVTGNLPLNYQNEEG